MSFKILERKTDSEWPEELTLTETGAKCKVRNFTGESGKYWVSILPAINVSGYGISEEEAIENLKYNVNLFWKEIFALDLNTRRKELRKLGWVPSEIFRRKFSKAYVDEEGVLQNFDSPELVKRNVLETA